MYVFEPDEQVLHAIEVYNPIINRYVLKYKSGRGY
jgi:hypothetical protein